MKARVGHTNAMHELRTPTERVIWCMLPSSAIDSSKTHLSRIFFVGARQCYFFFFFGSTYFFFPLKRIRNKI